MELPTAGDDAIRHTIGMSLPRTLTTLAGDEHAERGDEFMRLFIERADVVLHDMITLYEYVPSTADLLRRSGLTLGIVSSKYRRRIEQVLRRDGMEGKFVFIVGGEDVETLKPDPSGLLRAVDALGTPKERCLYVGDSVTDAETARGGEGCHLSRCCRVLPSERRSPSMIRRWCWRARGNCRRRWVLVCAAKCGIIPPELL